MLVLAAGIARHWDDPGGLSSTRWISGPLLVSAFSAAFMYVFSVEPVLKLSRATGRNLRGGYLLLLGLFWMTGPCAWVYAIPVERWNDPLGAAKWNMTMLGAVAVWRVLLVARSCAVLTRRGFGVCLLAVLWPAAAEFGTASLLLGADLSISAAMGGVRDVPPEDEFMLKVHDLGTAGGFLLALAAGLTLLVLCRLRGDPADP